MSEAVVDILRYHKYIVVAVYNGTDALAFAQAERYDGIILDIMMPGLSGLEVLRRLRAAGCRTPVLLLTAKAEVEDQIQGLDLGADDYLPKPFSMQLLLARVRALLRRREAFTPRRAVLRRPFPQQEQLRAVRQRPELPAAQAGVSADGAADAQPGHLPVHRGPAVQGVGLRHPGGAWHGVVYISYLRKRLTALRSKVRIAAKRNVGYTLEVADD